MSITISKWGNSLGIRIPSAVVDALSIRNGDTMNYEVKNDSIVLSRKKAPVNCSKNFTARIFHRSLLQIWAATAPWILVTMWVGRYSDVPAGRYCEGESQSR